MPDQSKVDGNVIIDQKSAEVALNGVYYCMAESGDDRGTPSTQLVYTHEIIPATLQGLIDTRYGGGELPINATPAESISILRTWTNYYVLVNASNNLIDGVNKLPASKISDLRRSEILGQAKFLRAYGHYMVLSYFGQYYDINSNYGALLRTEPVTISNIAKARSTVKESYDLIMNDVDFAIANAPNEIAKLLCK